MRRTRKNQGIITVFVTLILVPVVTFTGTMVDVARLKLYSAQAAMAADSYGEVVLSEYDNLLKELYGLFAVTQNEEGLQAINDLADYTKYSFDPNGDDKGLDGFMPYKNAKVKVSYTNVDGASLANNNVLMTQISDFMKFRVIEEVMGELNILDTLDQFDKMSSDMDAVNKRTEITKNSSKILGKIDEYFEILECINDYPGYMQEKSSAYAAYSKALKDVYDSDEYEAYVYYLDKKEEIDAAKERVEAAEEAAKNAETTENDSENTSSEEGNSSSTETVTEASDKDKDLAEKYVDVEEYEKELNEKFKGWDTSTSTASKKIKFGEADDKIDKLDDVAEKLKKTLDDLEEQIDELEEKLSSCSESLRTGIQEEIAELEEIAKMAEDFTATVNLLYNNEDPEKDGRNLKLWEQSMDKLEDVKENIIKGDQDTYDWQSSITFEWYDFQKDKSDFYSQLEALCKKSDNNAKGDKNAADEKISNAESVEAETKKKLEGDEDTDARDISAALAKELEKPENSADIPDWGDCLSGDASLASQGNALVGKFLLTTYDFGMFSSRVSGVKPPEDDESDESSSEIPDTNETTESEEYYDVSLTKVKMSRDVNYLYGAELEYLIGGYNESKDNLNYTRNAICGVRMTMNFISTYSIKKIDDIISNIASLAADAVTATGVGAAAAPLVRVAVSGALRLTVATLETVADWEKLMAREDVIFYKRSLGDMTALSSVSEFLGESVDESEKSDDIKLSYEDYMYILMCLFVKNDDLLDRTSDLITLNVNQSQNEGDTLETLDFKMSQTVTAVKSTCEVDLKFVIVPENYVNMFLSGSDAKAVIQKLDDGSYGYSVIRGY